MPARVLTFNQSRERKVAYTESFRFHDHAFNLKYFELRDEDV